MIQKILVKLSQMSSQKVLLLAGILTAAYYFTLFSDGAAMQDEIQKTKVELIAQEAKKKETEGILKEESRMKESINILGQQYQEITKQLPQGLSSFEINKSIDAFGRTSGVNVKSRKPERGEIHDVIEEVPVSVSAEGKFAEIAQFLYLIASSERITSLKKISISSTGKNVNLIKFEGIVVGFKLAEQIPAKPDPNAAGVKK